MSKLCVVTIVLLAVLGPSCLAQASSGGTAGWVVGGGVSKIIGTGTGGNTFDTAPAVFIECASAGSNPDGTGIGAALGLIYSKAANKVGSSSVDATFWGIYGEVRSFKKVGGLLPYYGAGAEWGTMGFEGAEGKAGLYKLYLSAGTRIPLGKASRVSLNIGARYALLFSDSDLGHSSGADLLVGVGW